MVRAGIQRSLSHSSGSMRAWLRMLRKVPTGISDFFGTIAVSTDESHVAPFLADFDEACGLKPALDLTKGFGLKAPQPRPQWYGHWQDALLAGARNGVPRLPLGLPAPLLLSRPDWRCRVPGIGRRTSFLHARQLPRRVASWLHCCKSVRAGGCVETCVEGQGSGSGLRRTSRGPWSRYGEPPERRLQAGKPAPQDFQIKCGLGLQKIVDGFRGFAAFGDGPHY
jgi:hypothetical protein